MWSPRQGPKAPGNQRRGELTESAIIGQKAACSAYPPAKAALRSFARVLAAELLPREIRVNAVSPGPIDTGILEKAFPDKDAAAQVREKMSGMVPMKRYGTSDEIAKTVLFFAFEATFTTG